MTREGAAEAAGHDGEWRRKKENQRRGGEGCVCAGNDGERKGEIDRERERERNLMEYSENGTRRLKGFP